MTHDASADPRRAAPRRSSVDADELARAEGEGMIAERTLPTPPSRRDLVRIWVARARARFTQVFRSITSRGRGATDATPSTHV